ncbi:Maintenance of telomere capping protein 6 [Sorochytrium milnesiophthora]
MSAATTTSSSSPHGAAARSSDTQETQQQQADYQRRLLRQVLRNEQALRDLFPLHRATALAAVAPTGGIAELVQASGQQQVVSLPIADVLYAGVRKLFLDVWYQPPEYLASIPSTAPGGLGPAGAAPSAVPSTWAFRACDSLHCPTVASSLFPQLQAWIDATNNAVDADWCMVVLNVRQLSPWTAASTVTTMSTTTATAASTSTTAAPLPAPTSVTPPDMPATNLTLSKLLSGSSIAPWIYTPKMLSDFRASPPDASSMPSGNMQAYPEQYLNSPAHLYPRQLIDPARPTKPLKRFIFAFSNTTSFVSNSYNTSSDTDVVFPAEDMLPSLDLALPAATQIQQALLDNSTLPVPSFLASDPRFQLRNCPSLSGTYAMAPTGNETSGVQQPLPSSPWSFATVRDSPSAAFDYDTLQAVTQCGYTPLVSSLNITALMQQQSDPAASKLPGTGGWANMLDLLSATVWSFDINADQPRNDSMLNCASANFSNNARWYASRCMDQRYLACQGSYDPNYWTISAGQHTWYDAAPNSGTPASGAAPACPPGTFFSVPKSPLENWFLRRALIARNVADLVAQDPTGARTAQSAPGTVPPPVDSVWLNYNDAYTNGCWVVGGGKCPYAEEDAQAVRNIVTVSAVGGILMLIVVAVFSWFKCRRYLRQSKYHRRRNDVQKRLRLLEHVGVPS